MLLSIGYNHRLYLRTTDLHVSCSFSIINTNCNSLTVPVPNLNVTKCPGPDNIHPRILYELRHKLVIPLKILFETSYNLGQLEHCTGVMRYWFVQVQV